MVKSVCGHKRVVITYGTFDLFHQGHHNLLQSAKSLGDYLIVGVSTDEFNVIKGKFARQKYQQRVDQVLACPFVDLIIPEYSWEQKVVDIQYFGAGVFVMGEDWTGFFDDLGKYAEVVYLPRTEGISSTQIRSCLAVLDDIS